MFDRRAFDAMPDETIVQWIRVGHYPGLHYAVYPQGAFRVPDSEEHIRVTRSPKQSDDCGIRFWVRAESAEDRNDRASILARYLRGAEFEAISEVEFNHLVTETSSELLVPLSSPLHQPVGFIGALRMFSLKTDFTVSLLAEYEDEFVHFFWQTTA
jgi:hypothetical protein